MPPSDIQMPVRNGGGLRLGRLVGRQVGQGGKEQAGLRAQQRWDRPRPIHIEVLSDDHATLRFNESCGPPKLLGTRRLGILAVLRRTPPPERHRDHVTHHGPRYRKTVRLQVSFVAAMISARPFANGDRL